VFSLIITQNKFTVILFEIAVFNRFINNYLLENKTPVVIWEIIHTGYLCNFALPAFMN
jgi:hypothetical protein